MKSLLVLRLSALGDIIHTMPAVVALANALGPHTRLGWVVEAPFAELVESVAPVDAVFRVATRRWRQRPFGGSTITELLGLRGSLNAFTRGETSVDFQGLTKSAILGALSGARRRLGFARAALREQVAGLFYTERVEVDRSLHVVELNMALARAAGAANGPTVDPDYSRFAADRDGALTEFVRERPVVLLPGAGRPEKQWNIDRFRLLADRLAKLLGSAPVVAWGPGERHIAEAIVSGGAATLTPPTDLRQLAFLLENARVVIGGDTGPLHLADALGTAVIGLFGPTNPRRNGPYHQLHRCVETWTTTRQVNDISVDAVLAKAKEILV